MDRQIHQDIYVLKNSVKYLSNVMNGILFDVALIKKWLFELHGSNDNVEQTLKIFSNLFLHDHETNTLNKIMTEINKKIDDMDTSFNEISSKYHKDKQTELKNIIEYFSEISSDTFSVDSNVKNEITKESIKKIRNILDKLENSSNITETTQNIVVENTDNEPLINSD